jgi:hypothetical protein
MPIELVGRTVKCGNCPGVYFRTTEYYDPTQILAGEMLDWLPRYGPEGLNWSLPFASHDLGESIICEGCGFPLAPTGILGIDMLILKGEGEPVKAVAGDDSPEPEKPAEEEPEVQEEEKKFADDDPIANLLVQKTCPECGGFFGLDEWENHLASHTPEVRAEIEGKPDAEAVTTKKSWKSKKR